MDTSEAIRRSNPGEMTTSSIVARQQDLIRELCELLTSYGPTWYTEEIDKRLSKMLAMPKTASSSPASRKLD